MDWYEDYDDGLTAAQRLRMADIEADEDRARRRRTDMKKLERELRRLQSQLNTQQGIIQGLTGRVGAQDEIIQAQRAYIANLRAELVEASRAPAREMIAA